MGRTQTPYPPHPPNAPRTTASGSAVLPSLLPCGSRAARDSVDTDLPAAPSKAALTLLKDEEMGHRQGRQLTQEQAEGWQSTLLCGLSCGQEA